jgi:hypothetical protein
LPSRQRCGALGQRHHVHQPLDERVVEVLVAADLDLGDDRGAILGVDE